MVTMDSGYSYNPETIPNPTVLLSKNLYHLAKCDWNLLVRVGHVTPFSGLQPALPTIHHLPQNVNRPIKPPVLTGRRLMQKCDLGVYDTVQCRCKKNRLAAGRGFAAPRFRATGKPESRIRSRRTHTKNCPRTKLIFPNNCMTICHGHLPGLRPRIFDWGVVSLLVKRFTVIQVNCSQWRVARFPVVAHFTVN